MPTASYVADCWLRVVSALVKERCTYCKNKSKHTANSLFAITHVCNSFVIFVRLCYGTAKTMFADIAKNFAEPSAKLHQRRGHIGCSPQQRRCKTTPDFAVRALGLLYLGAARRRRAVVRIRISAARSCYGDPQTLLSLRWTP